MPISILDLLTTALVPALAMASGAAGLLLAAAQFARFGPGGIWTPLRAASRAGRWSLAVVALAGTMLMLASIAVPFLAFFAAVVMLPIGAGVALRLRGTTPSVARLRRGALMTAASAVLIGVGQPLGLKVLALPSADTLPPQRLAARVLRTADPGQGYEGIAVGADGTLFLAANRGLDVSRQAYYRQAHGELIARGVDGREEVWFRTPEGMTAGMIAVAADGTLYLSSHGATPAIWHVRGPGDAERIASLPAGAWPNGIDIGPDGMLYAADSALGRIWRIDPRTGAAQVAIDDAQLAARPWIALAPGANGLHFQGRDLDVSVSDRATVLQYRLDATGHFGPARTLARGIPGDDFAIDAQGALWITTHPYNTLVRVAANGDRTQVGGPEQHIVGATAAAFGRGADDRATLYVVTDGGAFQAGASARGEIVALDTAVPDAKRAQSSLRRVPRDGA